MKGKTVRKALALLLALTLCLGMLPLSAAAADEDFTISDGGVLTAYTGTAEEVVIPDTVTTIGKAAFAGNTTMKKVVIPDSVILMESGTKTTGADRGPFHGCTALRTIEFSGTPKIEQITAYTFYGCTSLESVTIPASVKKLLGQVSGGPFQGCTALTTVNFAEGSELVTLGTASFRGCTKDMTEAGTILPAAVAAAALRKKSPRRSPPRPLWWRSSPKWR